MLINSGGAADCAACQNIANLIHPLSLSPRPSPTVCLALDYSLLLLPQYCVRHEYQDYGNNIDDCERCSIDELQDLNPTREIINYFGKSGMHAEIASRLLALFGESFHCSEAEFSE
jgi:hypothetical protein